MSEPERNSIDKHIGSEWDAERLGVSTGLNMFAWRKVTLQNIKTCVASWAEVAKTSWHTCLVVKGLKKTFSICTSYIGL